MCLLQMRRKSFCGTSFRAVYRGTLIVDAFLAHDCLQCSVVHIDIFICKLDALFARAAVMSFLNMFILKQNVSY